MSDKPAATPATADTGAAAADAKKYVTLVSSDGFRFVLDRDVAMVSGALRRAAARGPRARCTRCARGIVQRCEHTARLPLPPAACHPPPHSRRRPPLLFFETQNAHDRFFRSTHTHAKGGGGGGGGADWAHRTDLSFSQLAR